MRKGEYFLEALNYVDDKYIEEARYNTMKKRFNFKPIIAVAACAAIALAAIPVVNNFVNATPAVQGVDKIGANGNYTVYEGDTGMGSSGIGKLEVDHKVEFFINSAGTEFIDISKNNTTKKVQINGKTLVGEYKSSTLSDYYQDDRDNYEAIENGRKVQFSINKETGKCTLFFLSKAENENIENLYTRDECLEIALKYLSNYVDDIENYELKYEYERMGGFGYFFMLYRTVNGITTSDRVTIGVRENGEIYAHTLHSVGTMKNIDVSALDMEKVEHALKNKVDSVYKNTVDISYDVDNIVLTKLKDGSYVIDYFLLIEARNDVGDKIIKEECQFIVTID